MAFTYGSGASNGRLDLSTQSVQVITHEHHEVHNGEHFTISSFVSLATADDDFDIAITTPDTTKWLHLSFTVIGQKDTEFHIYEGATITDGSAVTAVNNNRNSSNTSDAAIVSEPTVSATGTDLLSERFGLSTGPQNADPGTTVRENEIILKQNTTYLIRMITRSDTNVVSYRLSWYEHTDKISPL